MKLSKSIELYCSEKAQTAIDNLKEGEMLHIVCSRLDRECCYGVLRKEENGKFHISMNNNVHQLRYDLTDKLFVSYSTDKKDLFLCVFSYGCAKHNTVEMYYEDGTPLKLNINMCQSIYDELYKNKNLEIGYNQKLVVEPNGDVIYVSDIMLGITSYYSIENSSLDISLYRNEEGGITLDQSTNKKHESHPHNIVAEVKITRCHEVVKDGNN